MPTPRVVTRCLNILILIKKSQKSCIKPSINLDLCFSWKNRNHTVAKREISTAKLWAQNLVTFLIIKYMLLSNILQWNTTHENGLKENSTSKMLALQLISKIVYRPILDVHVKALYVCTFDYDQFTWFLLCGISKYYFF